jgi:hypothetical protein
MSHFPVDIASDFCCILCWCVISYLTDEKEKHKNFNDFPDTAYQVSTLHGTLDLLFSTPGMLL